MKGLHRSISVTHAIDEIKRKRKGENFTTLIVIEIDGAANRGSLATSYKIKTSMASPGNISTIITIRHIFFHVYLVSKKTFPRAAKKTHIAVMAGAVEAPTMKISYLGYLFGE